MTALDVERAAVASRLTPACAADTHRRVSDDLTDRAPAQFGPGTKPWSEPENNADPGDGGSVQDGRWTDPSVIIRGSPQTE